MRDRLIQTLRQARERWQHRHDTPLFLAEALADAILADFVVMDPADHARLMAEVDAARRGVYQRIKLEGDVLATLRAYEKTKRPEE